MCHSRVRDIVHEPSLRCVSFRCSPCHSLLRTDADAEPPRADEDKCGLVPEGHLTSRHAPMLLGFSLVTRVLNI